MTLGKGSQAPQGASEGQDGPSEFERRTAIPFNDPGDRPNGMQGNWTRPPRTSPVRPAILAALPANGTPIRRRDVIASVQRTCPVAAITVDGYLREMTQGLNPPISSAGYGLYRLNAGGTP